MQVNVERFRQALKIVHPAVAGRKVTLPIAQSILVQGGQLHATNLELTISAPLPELDGEPFTFPARQMEETLAHLPGYETLVLSLSNHEIKLQTSKATFSLQGTDSAEFPPVTIAGPHEAQVDGDAFLAALDAMRPYVSKDQTRPLLNGVYFALGDPAEVAAADGFRLSWQSLNFAIAPQDGVEALVIPGETIGALKATWHIVPKTPALPVQEGPPHEASLGMAMLAVAQRPMRLTFDRARLTCHFGGVRVTTQLLQGQFPKYKLLIPTGQEKRVVVDALDFAQALRQLQHVASEGSGTVRMLWEDRAMRLVAVAEKTGRAEATIRCASQGGPAHIAFNIRYLTEYFQRKEGPVMLEVDEPSAPGLFSHRGVAHVVLMPVHAQWGDAPAPAESPASTVASTDGAEGDTAPGDAKGANVAEASVEAEPASPKPRPRRPRRTVAAPGS